MIKQALLEKERAAAEADEKERQEKEKQEKLNNSPGLTDCIEIVEPAKVVKEYSWVNLPPSLI